MPTRPYFQNSIDADKRMIHNVFHYAYKYTCLKLHTCEHIDKIEGGGGWEGRSFEKVSSMIVMTNRHL